MSQLQQDSASQSQFSKSSSNASGSRRGNESRILFPLLQGFEGAWPTTAVVVGLVIEMVQLLALVINHWLPWGGIVSSGAVPIYFTILPFWDQQFYVPLNFAQGSILFWILQVALLAFLAIVVSLLHLISEQLDRVGQDPAKMLLHVVTGAFFMPSLHLLLAYSVCDQDSNYLLAFRETGCLEGFYSILLFALAVFGMAVLVLLKLTTVVFLYDDHPGSLHWKARPHNVGELSLLGLQVTSAVLYHYLPGMGMRQAFCGIFAFGCLLTALVHVFFMPFYRQSVNTFRVVSLLVISYVAMVGTILLDNPELPTSNPRFNWSSLVVLAGGFVVALAGAMLASLRISRQCMKDLDAATNGEHSAAQAKARFPHNLPEEERTKLRENESIVLGEARFARTQESLTGPQQEREELRDELWVCTPYIDVVYCTSDVEVATRHLHVFQHRTGLRAPAPMIAMGIRIFSKGLAKFADDPWLELQLASYMCTLAPQRSQVALGICERIHRNENVDMALSFRATRRAASISAAMFIRDNSHKKSFVTAQLMHKEALINMKLFWGKLLADQVDIGQLGTLAKVITDRREEGLKCFERVVNESTDTFSLVRYAQFLDQVMMDTEAANNTREAVLDSLEQEQGLSAGGGGRESSATRANVSSAVVSTKQRSTSISRSRTISSLNRNINVIFSTLFAVMAGLLAFGIVMYTLRVEQADKLQAAGMARGLTQELRLYVDLLAYETNATSPNAATISSLSDALQSQLTAFREHHASLTYGQFKSSFKDVQEVFTLPRGEAILPNSSVLTQDIAAMGLWELGELFSSAIETIVASDATDAARAYAVEVVRNNAMDSVARLYNASIDALTTEAVKQLEIGEYVMIGLFLLSLVILFVVYFVLILNFRKISSSKLSTLSLFTLIPKNALEKLMDEGRERIEKFDQPDEAFEALKLQRGLEDDEDAMQQVMAVDNLSDTGKDLDLPGGAPTGAATPAVGGRVVDLTDDRDDDMDLHGKFASLLKNSAVGDTGKIKPIHHGQFEAPYSKDMWMAPVESADEVRERQRIFNELRVDEDLRMLKEAGSVDTNNSGRGGDGDGTGSDEEAQRRDAKGGALQTALSAVLVAMFALAIVLGALFVSDWSTNDSMLADRDVAERGLDNVYRYYRAVQTLRQAYEKQIFQPTTANFNAVQLVETTNDMDDAAVLALYRQDDASTTDFYDNMFAARRHQRVLEQQLRVLTRVVCDATNLACTQIRTTTNVWDPTLFVAPAELKLNAADESPNPPFSPTSLSFMNATARLQAAQRVVSSQYYDYLVQHVGRFTNAAAMSLEAQQSERATAQMDNLRQHAIVEVALSAVLIVLGGLTVVVLLHAYHTSSAMAIFGTIVLLLAAGATLGVAAPRCATSTLPEAQEARDMMLTASSVRNHFNASASLMEYLQDMALRVVFNADPVAAMNIQAEGGTLTIEQAWVRLGASLNPNRYDSLADAFDTSRLVMRQNLIAATLGASANNLYQPPALGLWWNFSAEVFGARAKWSFPTQAFYTDRITDLAKTPAAKKSLAIALLFGPLQADALTKSAGQFAAAVAHDRTVVTDEINARLASDRGFIVAGIGLAFGSACLSVLLMVQRLFYLMDAGSSGSRMGSGGGGSSSSGDAAAIGGASAPREDELFQKLTKQSRLALLLLAVLFSGLFVFTIIDFEANQTRSFDQNYASLREFYAIRSYASIQGGLNASKLNTLATRSLSLMLDASDRFYFGDAAQSSGALGRATNLDTALFGSSTPSRKRFDCTVAEATTILASNLTILSALDLGVDLAQRRWADVLNTVTVLPLASDRLARVKSLVTNFNTVLVAIRASTSMYTDVTKDAATNGIVGFLVILAVTFVVLVVLFFLIFRPMIGQLLNEEEGTKVMLKMIPAEVRESVPAIAEYLETGVVLQDMKMHEINEAAADLSTIPTITIDGQGTIVKFSRAAEDAFLWTKSETVGSNVSMLMPENIAAEHDTYLSNYRKTGVKTIINRQRKIRAKRKDGTLFPAEILVREVRSGRNTFFVGTLRNISIEIEFERAIVLSKAVSEAATVPIVVINSKGVIQRFNAAAEEAFKCGQEVVGRKVNVLMPMSEAEVHDTYLDRYFKTGIKTVVDQKRIVRGKKFNGELFPARLNVRELKRHGADSIFIGYVEDMTKQVHLEMASMVSEAIMATSPVPLIAMDDVGNIISWSPAAAQTFGILPQDALGKNVKMLMLDNVAQRHDSFIQSFLKTGRKKMIGNVTLQKAKRKEEDGTTTVFPVKIAVKDIQQQNQSTYFVAFVQDVSKQQQLETEYKISSSITNLSTLPLVTIDEKGIVHSFSAAAEVCFGWTKAETIGNNVTMLMPQSYRETHDQNIERYLATGVKTVIDINRKVQGITKEGRVFPMELMVREVKHDGKYSFVGYIRDISNDSQMAEANAWGDAISQLAVVPVLCIGLDGIIVSCSDSTCERFLWSREELVGQNISVLMPDSIGIKHPGYLAHYKHRLETLGADKARETSTLLHKERHVTARTRDEQHFQAAVHVRDLHINGTGPVFVGYIRDITDEVNQSIQRNIADAIVYSSSIPLICINTIGSITLFSTAAEKDFGYKQEDVMGKNIKMLMPDEVAAKHDGYLRSYVKTGIKNVIDSRRQVIAKKKNGTHFSVEITVKEVVQKDATGRDLIEYIGFVRDLTQQFILLQANTINDVVSQLATVPIIIINPRGQIIDFNHAASKEFGYRQEDAINRNIKMLMPEEIASQHDGYLQRYRQTRKKTIIDSTRRLTAKRRNGETFPCEISVREVIKEGTEGQFIGYIRDVSHEQMLVKQYAVNSAIIDLSTTPIIVIDIKGTISIFSRAAEETFGYSRSEVEGKNVKMLMPPDISVNHDSFLAAYAKTGKKNVIDTARRVRALRKRGTTFPAEISVKEIHSDDGQNIFIGYLLDHTQEAMLSAAAAFSECVNALSPVPIIAINHVGTIVRFSTAAEEEFRVTADVVLGRNIKCLQPQEVATIHDEYLARYLRTGVRTILGATRAIECKRWDGTMFHAEITTREVKDESDPNALPNFVGYIQNVEEEMHIEEAFKEGNAMVELAPIPVISLSLRGIITEANPACEAAFGFTRAEMLGKNIKMLMPKSIADQHDGYLERYLKTRVKTVIDTIRHVVAQRKNGSQFHVEIAVREIHVEGTENMYIGYVRDVTGDLKMAEAASLNEAVNSLSSTPLVVIDPIGTILKVSQAAEELFGYRAEEILDKNVKTLMPSSVAIKHDRFLETYRTTRKKNIVDSSRLVTGVRKDGSTFSCEIGVREVLQDDGKTTAVFVGYIRNLDEASLQVGQSAEINAMMMDLAVQGVIIIDRFGTVVRVNDAMLHMLQIPDREAIVGHNIKLLMPDAVAAQHDDYLAKYHETRQKKVIGTTTQVQGREFGTNKLVPLEIAVREIVERNKEIRYLGYIRRIDKELEIQSAKKTSAAALDLSPYATVVIDAKGTVLMFSRAAETMFEVPTKDVVGKNVKMLMPPEIAVNHDEYLATYRRTGEKHVIDSLRIVNAKAVASGRVFTVQLQIKECTFSIKGLESVFVGYISLYPSEGDGR